MAQIFHRSANSLARLSIIGVVVIVSVLLWAALEMQRSPYATYQEMCIRDSSTTELFNRQFTNRRIRMFITIPSARNMNSTEDPP